MKIAPQMEKDQIMIVCLSGRGDKDVAQIEQMVSAGEVMVPEL